MRILLLVMWLMLPIGAVAFHLGPGQDQMRMDEASEVTAIADDLIRDEKWAAAQEALEEALALVPEGNDKLRFELQLQRARVQMNNSQLPEAYKDLTSILDSLRNNDVSYPELESQARLALANSQYYMTWLKRLEGRSRDEWEPDVLAAQQNLRLLAEEAVDLDDESTAKKLKMDLEATVRLARMDLGELQGLPLPSQ